MIAGLLLAASLHDSLAVRDVRVAPGEVLRVTAVGTGPTVVFLPNLFGSARQGGGPVGGWPSGTYYAATSDSGGFVIPLPTTGSGTMTVTASGGSLGGAADTTKPGLPDPNTGVAAPL